MACFIVPAAQAVVTTVLTRVIKKKEPKEATLTVSDTVKIPFSRKLSWLSNLLWGGSALLMFEHIWHGEVVPWFPFLTATATPEQTSAMLNEIATAGVTMSALVTVVWLGMLGVSSIMEKKKKAENEGA